MITQVSVLGKRMILFGHSMGGLIATLCLIERPELFEGAILCSPCLQVIHTMLTLPTGNPYYAHLAYR